MLFFEVNGEWFQISQARLNRALREDGDNIGRLLRAKARSNITRRSGTLQGAVEYTVRRSGPATVVRCGVGAAGFYGRFVEQGHAVRIIVGYRGGPFGRRSYWSNKTARRQTSARKLRTVGKAPPHPWLMPALESVAAVEPGFSWRTLNRAITKVKV